MPDDFEAALAAKLASADEVETTASEPESQEAEVESEIEAQAEVAEEETEEQPRDDKGRFVAKDERPEWLPPQFKHVDDFVRSYGELQSVLGRQGQELGELRKIAEQIAESQGRQSQVPLSGITQALEENPEALAYWAAEQGNEQILDQALLAWNQKALDEGDAVSLRSAQRFEREIEIAKLKYEFSEEVTPSIEQVRQEAGKRALALARRELTAKYPDFDQVMESVVEDEVVGLDPNMLGQLQKTDPKAALEMVYRWVAVGRKASSQASSDAEREASKAEAAERKRQATVASSSAAPATREKSGIELFKEEILKPDPHSVYHGLTGS